MYTSEQNKYTQKLLETCQANKLIMKNGLSDLLKNYNPSYMYFSPFFGMVYGQYLQREYPQPVPYERVILDDAEEGKMVLDVAVRKTERPAGFGLRRYLKKGLGVTSESDEEEEPEKVVVLLHGITGNTRCYYV